MKLIYLLLSALVFSCSNNDNRLLQEEKVRSSLVATTTAELIDREAVTIGKRFIVPEGFEKPNVSANSYGSYLRNLPLKPHGAEVKKYDGSIKHNFEVYDAVVDMKIGNKDLHQCADAVMRFRAEYLWKQKRYADIHFNFTSGFRFDYTPWMEGKRLRISGNMVRWVSSQTPSNTYADFWAYMETVFTYAGTLSLSKELKDVSIDAIQIGDVFIRGGSPGHAVVVVDLAKDPSTNEKIILLAQSYMPAQETQVLKNPANKEISPWYKVSEIVNQEKVVTPEWTFQANELMRFAE